MIVCFTLQAEGCTLERWNTHKSFLKSNFRRLVQEVKAQHRREQETGDQSGQQRMEEAPPSVAGGSRHGCNDDSEESRNGPHQARTTSSSSASSTSTTTNARQPALKVKPIATIAALIRSELDLPSATISDTISMSMSALELVAVDTMTLKAKAIRVAQELDIPVMLKCK